MSEGKVFLVGAGPGDPGLLTRKAERILKSADIVLYDKLVDDRVIALVPKKIELIDVGTIRFHSIRSMICLSNTRKRARR
jgi:siroheme synthase